MKNSILLPDDHPYIQYRSDMRLICRPIMQTFKLNIFVYVRYYHDGSCIILSTHDEFLRFHLSRGYMVPAPVPIDLLRKQEAFHIIPTDGPFQKAKYDLLHIFQSGEAVDYIVRSRDYTDVACFAFWANDKYAINAIVNNLDEIKRYAFYVKESISPFLQLANEYKIKLPAEMRGICLNKVDKSEFATSCVKHKNKLSPQQLKIMYWVSRGKSAREIADNLGLSRRTIESHLAAVKIKLSVSSKSELIEKYLDDYYIDYM